MPYVIYHFAMLIFSLIGVSTTIMMVAEALFISLGYNIGKFDLSVIACQLRNILFTKFTQHNYRRLIFQT